MSVLLLLLLTHSIPAAAQSAEYFPFYRKDTLEIYQTAKQQRDLMVKEIQAPKGVNADYRKHYGRIVKSASNELFYTIRYASMQDTVVAPFVQQIFRNILQANPGLPPTRLYVSRSPVPNACAMMDGTILFNIGLLARLENESQIAAVLCHELAHVQARHSEQSINKLLGTIYEKDFQKEYKKIVRDEYNINSRMRDLLMGVTLNRLYHSRSHEKQADSLGFVFLSKTKYDVSQMYTMLQLLDHADEPLSKEPLNLSTFFGCPENRVNFEGAAKPKATSVFTVEQEVDELEKSDSLKTHPDCSKRMAYIEQMLGRTPGSGLASLSPRMQKVVKVCQLEVVQSWFDLEYYDLALFEALQLLPEHPGSNYLNSMVLLSLYELRQHMQLHDYASVVSNISDKNPKQLNDFLRVLHSLQLNDFKGLSSCFRQRYVPSPIKNEYHLAAAYAQYTLAGSATEAESARQQYLAEFKGGRFEPLIAPPKKGKRK